MTEQENKLLKDWLQGYIQKAKDSSFAKIQDTQKHKYLLGNDYHRAYQMYIRNNFRYKDYFLDWNKGKIQAREIREDKIFHYNDLHYLKNMNKLINN